MRKLLLSASALALTAAALLWAEPQASAQTYIGTPPPARFTAPGQPAIEKGEWPMNGGDWRWSRYSPLDQINAANFNKLEVAWRFKTDNFGDHPEYKLEGTPVMVKGVLYTVAGTRRAVVALDAKTGELLWTHSLREGLRAEISARQLSGRGVAYWTDGKGDERIIYVTTGYRLVELNAKTGAVIDSFGTDGIIDLKIGAVTGAGDQIPLTTGEIALHATPTVAGDVVIVGSSMKEGFTVPTHNNTKGLVRAFDVRTGKQIWRFDTIARPGDRGNQAALAKHSGSSRGGAGIRAAGRQQSARRRKSVAHRSAVCNRSGICSPGIRRTPLQQPQLAERHSNCAGGRKTAPYSRGSASLSGCREIKASGLALCLSIRRRARPNTRRPSESSRPCRIMRRTAATAPTARTNRRTAVPERTQPS